MCSGMKSLVVFKSLAENRRTGAETLPWCTRKFNTQRLSLSNLGELTSSCYLPQAVWQGSL